MACRTIPSSALGNENHFVTDTPPFRTTFHTICTTVSFANPDTGYFTRKAVKGDINGDGQVTIADVLRLVDILLAR